MLTIKQCHAISMAAIIAATLAAPAFAQQPARSSDAATSFAAVTAARPFLVHVEGKGRPMILIPGLTCDGTVWSQTVERYTRVKK